MATVNEQILSYLNNSKEGDELTILVNVQGTEFFVIYNPTTDRFERVLYSNVFNGDKIKDYLGYTPEDVANKATDFSTINNELYASLQAIKDYIEFLKSNPNGIAATDADGKILTSQLPPIAITSVILATETTISDFASNSGSYTFEQGDVIVLDNGNGNYFMYNGGTKTDVNSYNQITASEIDWSRIVNIPVEVRFPNLDVVLNNGNISSKGIIIGENIVVAPVGAPVTSIGSNSIGFTANDKFFITQVPENGGKLLSFDISNLTGSREIDIPDFGGTLPLLSPTETNDGDLAITGSFTGKGDGLTDVDADTLDSIDSSQFLRSDVDDTMLGRLNFGNANTQMQLIVFYKGDGSSNSISYTDDYLNNRIGGGGTFKGWRWSSFNTPFFTFDVITGVAEAHGSSISEIDAASGKVLITKEWVNANTGLPSGFYEEGTFTPTLSGGSYTFNTVRNDYIRIGNKKTFYFTLTNINGTGNSGQSLRIGVGELLSDLCESTLRRISGSDITEEYKCEITNSAGNSVFIKKGDDLAQSNVDFTNGVLSGSITIITNVYTP